MFRVSRIAGRLVGKGPVSYVAQRSVLLTTSSLKRTNSKDTTYNSGKESYIEKVSRDSDVTKDYFSEVKKDSELSLSSDTPKLLSNSSGKPLVISFFRFDIDTIPKDRVNKEIITKIFRRLLSPGHTSYKEKEIRVAIYDQLSDYPDPRHNAGIMDPKMDPKPESESHVRQKKMVQKMEDEIYNYIIKNRAEYSKDNLLVTIGLVSKTKDPDGKTSVSAGTSYY